MLLVIWFIVNGQLVWLDGWHPVYVKDCHSAKTRITEYLETLDAPESLILCIPQKN